MILFKVWFKNNMAVSADAAEAHRRPVQWKENPYQVLSMEVWANNTWHAIGIAQAKAIVLLKAFH